jgi:enamine deaminase RidA (YjgF/YER057c/UK114 family)
MIFFRKPEPTFRDHALKEGAMAAAIRFINPEGLSRSPAYTQVVEVSGAVRTIYISGQLGIDRDGALVSRDFRAQAAQVFENLKAALAAVGARFADVVKLNSYLADIAHLPVLREVRAQYLDPAALPASTTLGGASFAREGALLEVEAVAVVAARARSKRARAARRVKAARRTRR